MSLSTDRLCLVRRVLRGSVGLPLRGHEDEVNGGAALRHDRRQLHLRSSLVDVRHPHRRQLCQDTKLSGLRHLLLPAHAVRLLPVVVVVVVDAVEAESLGEETSPSIG